MIIDDFDSTTIASLEEALERTAERFPEQLSEHETRSWLARRLLEIARDGQGRLATLTEAAHSAAAARFNLGGAAPDRRSSFEDAGEQPHRWSAGAMAAAGPHASPELTDEDKTPGCGMLPGKDDTNPSPTG